MKGEEQLDNREKKKHEMVLLAHKKNKDDGSFETITEIFSRLPLPRMEKNNYKFIFEQLKGKVESILEQENRLSEIRADVLERIDDVEIKIGKPVQFNEEEILRERLGTNKPLFQSLVYLKNQKNLGFSKWQGQLSPFLEDMHYIDFSKIQQEIPHTKLFLEGQPPLKKQKFEFINENEVIFKNKSFPSSYEIDKRAQTLAKLYLLDLYKEETRKMMVLDKNDEAELEKKREMNKIKQERDIDKMKEGEIIEEVDLMKQVTKIMQIIERNKNAQAYSQFQAGNGERAIQIKKSLEKLKATIYSQPIARTRLKLIIAYKHKKGW